MTLNGVIALILRFTPNSIALQADYVTVTYVRKILRISIFQRTTQLWIFAEGVQESSTAGTLCRNT